MPNSLSITHASTWVVALASALAACSTEPTSTTAEGGATATGGNTATTGGTATGGTVTAATGGTATGGTVTTATGGIATGGTVTTTTGGSASGGLSTGGTTTTGGTVGTSTGGSTSGGAANGGAAGAGGTSAGKGGTSATTGGGGGGTSTGGAAGAGGMTTGALCPANAVFCEDFEDGNLDGWTKDGSTLVVNSAKPSHGTGSLQIDVAAMQYGGSLIRKGAPLFPLPNKRMWGRLMIYFDTIADGHTDFIRGAATNGATPQYNIAEQHGEIMLNYYAGSASDCWARPKPGKVVPLKTWMCWEWSFDGAANQMQFYIDGTLSRQVDATGDGCLSNPTQTWVAPTFSELRIGEYIAERSPNAQRIWIDDIAVGTTSRIACPAP